MQKWMKHKMVNASEMSNVSVSLISLANERARGSPAIAADED